MKLLIVKICHSTIHGSWDEPSLEFPVQIIISLLVETAQMVPRSTVPVIFIAIA